MFRYYVWTDRSQIRSIWRFKKTLLDTGDKRIVIAGIRERFWGAGVALNDDAAADPTKLSGKNKLGEALKLDRDKLKWL